MSCSTAIPMADQTLSKEHQALLHFIEEGSHVSDKNNSRLKSETLGQGLETGDGSEGTKSETKSSCYGEPSTATSMLGNDKEVSVNKDKDVTAKDNEADTMEDIWSETVSCNLYGRNSNGIASASLPYTSPIDNKEIDHTLLEENGNEKGMEVPNTESSKTEVKNNLEDFVNGQHVTDGALFSIDASVKENGIEHVDLLSLSGKSLTNESETSSGPLFRTPLERRGSKKPWSDFEERPEREMKTLRPQRNRVPQYGQDEGDDICCLTPEESLEVVKSKETHKTYSRKDKDANVKGKQFKQKVTQWLQNVPEVISNNYKVNKAAARKTKENAECSKKALQLQMQEQMMGQKMRSLAEQVAEKNQDLEFNFEDFDEINCGDGEEATKAGTLEEETVDNNSSVHSEGSKTNAASASDNTGTLTKAEIFDSDMHAQGIEGKTKTVTDSDTADVRNKEKDTGDNSEIETLHNMQVPKHRKRIFKSRSGDSDKFLQKGENGGNKETAADVEKKEMLLLNNKTVDEENVTDVSDPYEFKSSQPTPRKTSKTNVGSKKTKRKASSGNKFQKEKRKRATESNFIEDTGNMRENDSVPLKTILCNKTKSETEADRLAVKVNEAEHYDLLTCTQDVLDTMKTDSRKKVSFAEPVITDFIEAEHIDLIGYRKAKEKFNNSIDDLTDNGFVVKKSAKVEIAEGGEEVKKSRKTLKNRRTSRETEEDTACTNDKKEECGKIIISLT